MTRPLQLLARARMRPDDVEVAAHRTWPWIAPFTKLGRGLFGRAFRSKRSRSLVESNFASEIAMSSMGPASMGNWTHRLLLRWSPGQGVPDGALRLRVGEDPRGGIGAELTLDASTFGLPDLEAAFQEAMRAGFADQACLGPAGLAIDDRINVLTFTKQFQTGELPSGSRATAMGGGVVIRACALSAPEAEMRQAVLDVAKALAGTAAAAPMPSPTAVAAEPEPAVAPPPLAVPALVPQPPPAPRFDPDETLPMIATFVAPPAVPFSGTISPAAAAAMFDPVEPREKKERVNPDETAFLPVVAVVAPETGTFRDQLGPLVVPLLGLSEYAELRARLTVYGEAHEPTLKRFGVAAREVREALRARFADYFQRDAAAQAQFLTGMQEAIVRVRKERDGGSE